MELNQKKHDIENIADAMEGGGSGGGGCDCEIDISELHPIDIESTPNAGNLYIYVNGEWLNAGYIMYIDAPNPETGLYFKITVNGTTNYAIRTMTGVVPSEYTQGITIGQQTGFYLMDSGEFVFQRFATISNPNSVFTFVDLTGKNIEYQSSAG